MSSSEQRSEVATDSRFLLSLTLDVKYLCPFAARYLHRVPVAIFCHLVIQYGLAFQQNSSRRSSQIQDTFLLSQLPVANTSRGSLDFKHQKTKGTE